MLKKYNTHSWACREQLLAIARLSLELDCILQVFWVASRDNVADAPSRLLHRHVYTAPPWVARLIRQRI
jgi:hypothetical protein